MCVLMMGWYSLPCTFMPLIHSSSPHSLAWPSCMHLLLMGTGIFLLNSSESTTTYVVVPAFHQGCSYYPSHLSGLVLVGVWGGGG